MKLSNLKSEIKRTKQVLDPPTAGYKGPMTLKRARQILGSKANHLTGKQLQDEVNALRNLARVFFSQYEKEHGIKITGVGLQIEGNE